MKGVVVGRIGGTVDGVSIIVAGEGKMRELIREAGGCEDEWQGVAIFVGEQTIDGETVPRNCYCSRAAFDRIVRELSVPEELDEVLALE